MERLILPALRGRMGDWMYYVTILPFSEVGKRVSMVDEIHKDKGLGNMIQRKVTNRTKDIVDYLKTQDQRFFNSLILGIYGGKPQWQEIDIDKKNTDLDELEIINLSKTFGILTLNGEEQIFAIDGQHRSKAIKEAIKEEHRLSVDEIPVIIVAHRKDEEGQVRTRRLFSTLNRYAKPVNISEIIALDEEDNCAIITRNIVENFELLRGKIAFNQNRSISPKNNSVFTNIIVLYDIVKILTTNAPILGEKTSGADIKVFTKKRQTEQIIKNHQDIVEKLIKELFEKIPVLSSYLIENSINRSDLQSSLLFKPIGQIVFFSILKIGIERNKKDEVIKFFIEEQFNLNNPNWRKIFYNEDTGNINTDKSLQRYAIQLILKKLNVDFKTSKKDKEIDANFLISL